MTEYELPDSIPADGIPTGTNVLVAGPPLTGKRQLGMSLLEAGCERDEGAVIVGARDSTRSIMRSAPAVWNTVTRGRGGIVDCVTRQGGASVRDDEQVKYVASPGDVTDIGIRLGGLFQDLGERCDRTRMNVSTVSTMLMYADPRRVYRFLHVFTGHVERLDWLGVGVLDTNNREAFDTIAPLYDGMLQTRTTADGAELRVVGFGEGRTDWVAH